MGDDIDKATSQTRLKFVTEFFVRSDGCLLESLLALDTLEACLVVDLATSLLTLLSVHRLLADLAFL